MELKNNRSVTTQGNNKKKQRRLLELKWDQVKLINDIKSFTSSLSSGKAVEKLATISSIEERVEWVEQTLNSLGVNTSKASSLRNGEFITASFLDREENPATVLVVPLAKRKYKDITFDYVNSIVQLVLLAERLKSVDNYVNIHLVFVAAEEMLGFRSDLQELILKRHIPGTVGEVLVPSYITGISPDSASKSDNVISKVCVLLRDEGDVELSYDIIIEVLENDYSNFCLQQNKQSFDLSFLAFGVPGQQFEEDPERNIQKRQIQFAQTEKFTRVNDQLLQMVILLSRINREYELDNSYLH